jgi:hypothetical protein
MIDIRWKLPWQAVGSDAGTLGLQRELEKEVGPKHPLWGRTPTVIGRRIDNDDVLVHLSDGSLACVHLVWHGKIDIHPEKYPWTVIYSSVSEFLSEMQQDAIEYGEKT